MSLAATQTSHTGQQSIHQLVERLQAKYGERITGELHIPEKAGEYRALPGDLDPRLAIVRKLRSGSIDCVVTIAVTWQRIGRAGRRQRPAWRC